ncbi:hypothetical protein ABZP36_005141 [Zizania latifolia]
MGAQAMSSHHSRGALSRQGSLCGVTRGEVDGQLHGGLHLRTAGSAAAAVAGARKTVDEVWRDIQGTANGCLRAPPAAASAPQMTLEDFLSRAGAVAPDAADSGSGCCAVDGALWAPQQPHQQRHHHHHHVGRPVPRPLGVGAGPVLDALYHDGAVLGRKRAPDPTAAAAVEGAAAEKTVERRKKRMIKNRESAARSRARKQAYTNELENKIAWLEEENERLRMHKVSVDIVPLSMY